MLTTGPDTDTTSDSDTAVDPSTTGETTTGDDSTGPGPGPWLDECPSPGAGVVLGNLASPAITEASGLVWSRAHADVLWTHNDSGGSATAFALNSAGDQLGSFALMAAGAVDWEDIAIGPGPLPGQDYLYLGDIGDNFSTRPSIQIYRVAEPANPDLGGGQMSIGGVATLEADYPDGPHDAKTLMVDPVSGDLFIVTEAGATSQLFRWPAPQLAGPVFTLEEVGTVAHASNNATAGDISPLGDFVIVRTGNSARLWLRAQGTPLADAFDTEPCELPLVAEFQGEAIAIHPAGDGYTTLGEALNQPLWDFGW